MFFLLQVHLERFLQHGRCMEGGGGFSAKFQVGMCRTQFQNAAIGKANFCDNGTLGYRLFDVKSDLSWRFLEKTCHIFAFSRSNLFLDWDFYRNHRILAFL